MRLIFEEWIRGPKVLEEDEEKWQERRQIHDKNTEMKAKRKDLILQTVDSSKSDMDRFDSINECIKELSSKQVFRE